MLASANSPPASVLIAATGPSALAAAPASRLPGRRLPPACRARPPAPADLAQRPAAAASASPPQPMPPLRGPYLDCRFRAPPPFDFRYLSEPPAFCPLSRFVCRQAPLRSKHRMPACCDRRCRLALARHAMNSVQWVCCSCMPCLGRRARLDIGLRSLRSRLRCAAGLSPIKHDLSRLRVGVALLVQQFAKLPWGAEIG